MDKRARRTRHALIESFNRLVLERRVRDVRVADVIGEAKVGRSTFYDHYSSADALHMDALKAPLAPLADAAAGVGDPAALSHILRHFWEYRQRARHSLDDRAERLLAAMVEERLAAEQLAIPARLAARQLASAAFAPVAGWLTGEAPCQADTLAASIVTTGLALRLSLQAADRRS